MHDVVNVATLWRKPHGIYCVVLHVCFLEWLRRTWFLSAPKTFVNVPCRLEWISVHILCSLITHLISGLVLVRSSLNHSIILPFWVRRFVSEYTPLTSPSFRVGLLRTVSGSVCLNAEKMTLFVNIFHISFPSFRHFRHRHRGKKVEPLLCVCGIVHCTWLRFETKHEGNFIVGRPTNNVFLP